MENEIFYRQCHTRGCRAINGFSLSYEQKKKDEEYACFNCVKEHKLSKWKESTEEQYNDKYYE